MHQNPRIRRLGLIRVSEPDEGVRRYLLARLDDISLATPHSQDGAAAAAVVRPLPSPDGGRRKSA
jgi:hypothetical protein